MRGDSNADCQWPVQDLGSDVSPSPTISESNIPFIDGIFLTPYLWAVVALRGCSGAEECGVACEQILGPTWPPIDLGQATWPHSVRFHVCAV